METLSFPFTTNITDMNKEQRAEYRKKYYLKNKDKILQYQREKAKSNPSPSKRKDYRHQYYLKNREAILEKQKADRQSNTCMLSCLASSY